MIEIRAQRSLMLNAVQLAIFDRDAGGQPAVGEIVFTRHEPGRIVNPAVALSDEAATVLMDELWAAGVRPTQQGSVGQLAAVSYHLEDMRKLVFKGAA